MEPTIIGVRCPYHVRMRMPKWNGPINVLHDHRVMRRLAEFSGWTNDQHVTAALDTMQIASNYRRMWLKTVDAALVTYGNGSGVLISGVYRDHYPARVKYSLRSYAHLESEYLDRSVAHWRAAGRRVNTWRSYKQSHYGDWGLMRSTLVR